MLNNRFARDTFLIAMLAVMPILLFPHISRAESVAKFTFVRGRVDVLRVGEKRAKLVRLGEVVNAGDIVRTKSKSRAQLLFVDGTKINISQKSRIQIKEYMFNPDKTSRSVIKSFRGTIRAIVSKFFAKKNSLFNVETPTAIVGVKGTDFITSVLSPFKTDVMVLKGRVSVRNIDPAIVNVVIVGPNQVINVLRNKPPSAPRNVTREDMAPAIRGTDPEGGDEGDDDGPLPGEGGSLGGLGGLPTDMGGDPGTTFDPATIDVLGPIEPETPPITETLPETLTTPVQIQIEFPDGSAR